MGLVTAGWQELESADSELREHLSTEVVNLGLYHRAEAVFAEDPELAESHRSRQDRLRALQSLHRVRLRHTLEAARQLMARTGGERRPRCRAECRPPPIDGPRHRARREVEGSSPGMGRAGSPDRTTVGGTSPGRGGRRPGRSVLSRCRRRSRRRRPQPASAVRRTRAVGGRPGGRLVGGRHGARPASLRLPRQPPTGGGQHRGAREWARQVPIGAAFPSRQEAAPSG